VPWGDRLVEIFGVTIGIEEKEFVVKTLADCRGWIRRDEVVDGC